VPITITFDSFVDASSFSVSTWTDTTSSFIGEKTFIGLLRALLLSVLDRGELIKSLSFSKRLTG
jgi:hypothetical protein